VDTKFRDTKVRSKKFCDTKVRDTKVRDKKFRNKNTVILRKFYIISRNFAGDIREFREIKRKVFEKRKMKDIQKFSPELNYSILGRKSGSRSESNATKNSAAF
jgi:hypothetical protein